MKSKSFQGIRAEITGRTISWVALLAAMVAGVVYAGCQYTISGNPDVDLVEVRMSPGSALITAGGSLPLTATISGTKSDASYTWSITGDTASHLTTNGLTAIYQAPDSALVDPMLVTITVSSNEDPSKVAKCTLTIINTSFNPGEVVISPVSVNLLTSNSLQLNAHLYQTTGNVTWKLVSGPGSVSSNGLYIPPAALGPEVQAVVQATSSLDTTQYSQSFITLIAGTDSLRCFSGEIYPLLQANCGTSDCHGGGGTGALDVNSYDGIVKSVQPGNARGSRLYQAITELDRNTRMPPAPHPTLSAAQVLAIGQWIDEGAQNTQCQ